MFVSFLAVVLFWLASSGMLYGGLKFIRFWFKIPHLKELEIILYIAIAFIMGGLGFALIGLAVLFNDVIAADLPSMIFGATGGVFFLLCDIFFVIGVLKSYNFILKITS